MVSFCAVFSPRDVLDEIWAELSTFLRVFSTYSSSMSVVYFVFEICTYHLCNKSMTGLYQIRVERYFLEICNQ